MRTGKQYLESLRDGRKVYVGGEIIEDVTAHPMTKGYANAIAEYYDLHLDPANEAICTFTDDQGQKQSMHWFIPKSKEAILHYLDQVCMFSVRRDSTWTFTYLYDPPVEWRFETLDKGS